MTKRRSSHHLSLDGLIQLVDRLAGLQLPHLEHAFRCAACRARVLRMLPDLAAASPAAAPAEERRALPPRPRLRLRDAASPGLAAAAAEAAEADELLVALWQLPSRRRQEVANEDPRFHTLPVVLRLLDRAYEATASDPEEGGKLATLAARVCRRLNPLLVPAALRRDLETRAWLLMAHALGLRGLTVSAERAFRLAAEQIADPAAVEAGLFSRLLGSLLHRQGRSLEAMALLERAARLLHAKGEGLEEGLALQEWAALQLEAGRPEAGLTQLGRALGLTAPWSAPGEVLRQRLALASLHAVAGQRTLAEELLAEAMRGSAAAGVELPALALLVRARLALAWGERGEAERLLAEAWRAALADRAIAEAATAAFQRAALYAGAGRRKDCARLAAELDALLVPHLLSQALQGGVRRLQQALRGGEADLRFLLGLQDRFRRRLLHPSRPLESLAVLLDEPLAVLFGASQPQAPPAPGTPPGGGFPDEGGLP